jgi:hypothetical protein
LRVHSPTARIEGIAAEVALGLKRKQVSNRISAFPAAAFASHALGIGKPHVLPDLPSLGFWLVAANMKNCAVR